MAKNSLLLYVLFRQDCLSFGVGWKGRTPKRVRNMTMPKEKMSCLVENYFWLNTSGGPQGLVKPGRQLDLHTMQQQASPKSIILVISWGHTRMFLGVRSMCTMWQFFRNLNPFAIFPSSTNLFSIDCVFLFLYKQIYKSQVLWRQSIMRWFSTAHFCYVLQYFIRQADFDSFRVFNIFISCSINFQAFLLRGYFMSTFFYNNPYKGFLKLCIPFYNFWLTVYQNLSLAANIQAVPPFINELTRLI